MHGLERLRAAKAGRFGHRGDGVPAGGRSAERTTARVATTGRAPARTGRRVPPVGVSVSPQGSGRAGRSDARTATRRLGESIAGSLERLVLGDAAFGLVRRSQDASWSVVQAVYDGAALAAALAGGSVPIDRAGFRPAVAGRVRRLLGLGGGPKRLVV